MVMLQLMQKREYAPNPFMRCHRDISHDQTTWKVSYPFFSFGGTKPFFICQEDGGSGQGLLGFLGQSNFGGGLSLNPFQEGFQPSTFNFT